MTILLTKTQEKVTRSLQDGCVLITDSESKWVEVGRNFDSYKIQSALFWRLVDKGIIYQSGQSNGYDFILTKDGEDWTKQEGEK